MENRRVFQGTIQQEGSEDWVSTEGGGFFSNRNQLCVVPGSNYKEVKGGRDFLAQKEFSATVALFAKVEQDSVYDIFYFTQEIVVVPNDNRSIRVGEYIVSVDLLTHVDANDRNAQQTRGFAPYPVGTYQQGSASFECFPPVALMESLPRTGISSSHTEDGFNASLSIGKDPSVAVGMNHSLSQDVSDVVVSNVPNFINPKWIYTINNIRRDYSKTSKSSIAGTFIRNQWVWRVNREFGRQNLYARQAKQDNDGYDYFLGMRYFLEVKKSELNLHYDSRRGCCGCILGCLCFCCDPIIPEDDEILSATKFHRAFNIIPVDVAAYPDAVKKRPQLTSPREAA